MSDSLGGSAILGAIGGGAALFFAGPIIASSVAVSMAVGSFKLGRAATRDQNRKKLAPKNTSDRNN